METTERLRAMDIPADASSQFSIFSKLPTGIRTLAAHFYNPANNMER